LFSAEYVENQLWGSPLGCLVIAGKPRLWRIAVAESRSEIIINRRGSHRQAEVVTGKQRWSQARCLCHGRKKNSLVLLS